MVASRPFSLLVCALCSDDVSGHMGMGMGHGMGMGSPALQPPCRKASIMRTIHVPSPDGGPGVDNLILTAGKGFVWERKERENGRGYGRAKRQVLFFNDTWVFSVESNSWAAVETPGGGELQSFSGRWKAEADSVRLGGGGDELAVFAGCTTETSVGVQNDLWIFTPTSENPAQGTWRQVPTENPPSARRGHVVVSNSSHLIIYGGKDQFIERPGITPNNCITDLWAIPLASLTVGSDVPARWTQGASLPAECRWGATGTILTRPDGREVLALFGGRNLNPNATWHSTSAHAYTYFNELWVYDFQADSWSQEAKDVANKPSKRDHHGADVMNGDLWLFSGRVMEAQDQYAATSDVWSFSLASGEYTRHSVMSGPIPRPRFMPGVAGIRRNGEMQLAIFGGESLPGSTKRTTLNDVWAYSPSLGHWEMLSDSHCHDTPVYYDPPLAHAAGQLVLAQDQASGSRLVVASASAAGGLASLLVAALVAWRRFSVQKLEEGTVFQRLEA